MRGLAHFGAILAVTPWGFGAASPFPPKPVGVTTVQTNDTHGSWLSYKETHICETTPGVRAYAGYIHLPPSLTGEKFNINTFYWFFEARKNPETAPLTIYLAGGPGEPSMNAVFGEMNGPCYINDDYNSTTLNEWSWNGESNMIYIDQPVQTGFSYDEMTNVTVDQFTNMYTPADFSKGVPETNETFLVGTVASQNPGHVTAGSVRGASALWHFMQIWTSHFPKYPSSNDKLSIWGNSWSGFYSAQTFAYFERQNDKVRSGGLKGAHELNLDTLGITNGCVDPLIEAPHYPEQAINNTYGYKAYSEEIYQESMHNLTKPHGCTDLVNQCRSLAAVGDPDYQGTNATVNAACSGAFAFCWSYVQGSYLEFGKKHSGFDMAHQPLDPFPLERQNYFLNQAWVQSALGVPVNFTTIANAVEQVYTVGVGDAIRSNVTNLSFVLSRGLSVVMVFGDRDYRCNWLGGEAISLAAEWPHTDAFRSAGYADLHTNASYQGGYVRQSGGFSFSRVFQAGHAVGAYQPETVFRVFQRALQGVDVATGTVQADAGAGCEYKSKGPLVVRNVTQTMPPEPPLDCDTWSIAVRCSENQQRALMDGTAVIEGAKVVKPAQ